MMTPDDSRSPRQLKPGDLYVVTKDGQCLSETYRVIEVGQKIFTFMNGTMRLVCRHPCGALEFLILPNENHSDAEIPACQDIST